MFGMDTLAATNQIYNKGQFVSSSLGNIVHLAAGMNHVLVVNSEGRVYTFGDNGSGQLGHYESGPATPIGLLNKRIVRVAGGEVSFFGALYTAVNPATTGTSPNICRDPCSLRLGVVTVVILCTALPLTSCDDLQYNSLALDTSGIVYSWGANWDGQSCRS
jgi:alpha-tubulin suppressor-like RCC1 family protein